MTQNSPTDPRSPEWRVALPALGASLAGLVIVHRETFGTMVETWARSETFAHGFFIAPIVAILIWSRRRVLAAIPPAPNPWGLAALAALSLGWLLGWAANVRGVQQLSATLMIPALVVAIAGAAVARAAAFPLGYLLFAVPVGEALVPPLTEFTARFTVASLRLVGVPVSQDGLYLNVPGAAWEVSKACSGIRYLIASVSVGSLFAYLTYRSIKRRIAFVAICIVVPILSNGARAVLIVLLGYMSSGKIATGIDHIIYGWLFFAVITLLLLWFGARWREPEAAHAPRPAVDPPRGGPRPSTMKLASATALAVTIFLAAPLAAYVVDRRAGDDGVSPPRDAPPAAAGWSGPVETADDWSPHFESPEEENRKAYWHGANRVELYAASYRHERQGSELINSKNRVYDPESWRRVGERVREIRVNARRFRVIQTDLLHPSPAGAQRRLAWHWYVVAGEPMTDPILAKFAEAKARLLGLREGSAAVVVAADYKDSQNDAARLLEEFLRAHGPALQAAFTKGADRARP